MNELSERAKSFETNRQPLDQQDSELSFRSILAAIIGNMLEFYDFVTFSFFRDRDRARFLPIQKSIREPYVRVGNLWPWVCNQTCGCTCHRDILRSCRTSSRDDVELYDDGARHRCIGADALLRVNWYRRAYHRYYCPFGARLVVRRRSGADDGLFIGSGTPHKTWSDCRLAACQPADRRNNGSTGWLGSDADYESRGNPIVRLAYRLPDWRIDITLRTLAAKQST